jgi:hypothetical protein
LHNDGGQDAHPTRVLYYGNLQEVKCPKADCEGILTNWDQVDADGAMG